jgi:hypothetical protein
LHETQLHFYEAYVKLKLVENTKCGYHNFMNTPGLQVEFAASTMGLNPCDLPRRASWGSDLERLPPYLEQTGCRNFEVWPSERIVEDVKARVARGDTELVERVIGSLHESPFDGRDWIGRLAIGRGIVPPPRSTDAMMEIQAALPWPVPAIRFLNGRDGSTGAPFLESSSLYHAGYYPPTAPRSFSAVQPEAELYRDFVGTHGKLTEEKFIEVMCSGDTDGICPDSIKARAKIADGSKPPPWKEAWPAQFASGRAYESHIGLDRDDVGWRGDPELAAKSHEEFMAFTSRSWRRAQNTETGDMITAAIENYVPPELIKAIGQPILRLVIEMMPSVRVVPSMRRRSWRPQDFLCRTAQHARVVKNLANIASEAGAKVLLWGDAA